MPRTKEVKDEQAGYYVIAPFQDADGYSTEGLDRQKYEIGDDVSHFDESRLQSAIDRGLVEKRGGESTEETESK